MLTSHSCSEEGLEDAANILLQLSRGDGATRDTVLKLLLSGARHLGYTLCKQIGEYQSVVIFLFKKNIYFLNICFFQAHYWLNSENIIWSSRDVHKLIYTPQMLLKIPQSQPGLRER